MNQNFAAFIEPARSETRWWKVILTLVVFGIGYMVLSTVFLGVVSQKVKFVNLDTGRFDTPLSLYVLLCTFIIWVAVFWAVVKLFHKRGLATILGKPKRTLLRNFLIAVAAFGGFLIITQLLAPNEDNIVENITAARWWSLLPLGLFLMLIQVSAEELLFRGYLQQQFAMWINSRWFYMLVPSVLFGFAHFDGSMGMQVGLMVCAATGMLGLFLADLTYRTGNLGAAIGIHFANNFSAMFWVSYQEQVSGLARYIAPDYFEQPDLFVQAAQTMLISTAVMFSIYFAIMEWRERR